MADSFHDPPPSYEVATTPTSSAASLAPDIADAVLVFYIPDGVQIFFITPEGYVSAPSYPSSLAIYQFTDDVLAGHKNGATSSAEAPPAFLQIGDWMYPLLPGHSPVLHANWGAYVFPDVSAVDPGSCVGVTFPDSVDAADRKEFEKMLQSLTELLQHQGDGVRVAAAGTSAFVEQPQRTSQVISSILSTAADWISWGLVKGAEKAGEALRYGSTKLRENMDPATQPSHIDPRAEQGAYYARCVTRGAVKVSGFLVNKLSESTGALCRIVAPHIRRHSENLLPRSLTERNADGISTFDNVAEVAASGLHGFATVYTSLERSAKILAKSLSDETVHIVQHKYGEDAGRFADHIVHTATGVTTTSYNLSHLGIKAVAKQVAFGTTVAVADIPADSAAASSRAEGDSQVPKKVSTDSVGSVASTNDTFGDKDDKN
jgi:spartin